MDGEGELGELGHCGDACDDARSPLSRLFRFLIRRARDDDPFDPKPLPIESGGGYGP